MVEMIPRGPAESYELTQELAATAAAAATTTAHPGANRPAGFVERVN